MKICLVQPGASISTHDVFTGLACALEGQGHDLVYYRLDQRIAHAGGWLKHLLKKAGKEPPTSADILYLACAGILERALRHEVDWVLVVSGMYFHPDFFILMQRAGLRVALMLTESPYDDERQIRVVPHVNVCWTNERTSVAKFREVNPHTYYLPHAFNPAKHFPGRQAGDELLPEHDVVFVGTGFEERIELLSAVDWDGIDFGLYGAWGDLGSRHGLRKFLREKEIENEVTTALYRKAQIGLNLHRKSMGFGRGAPKIKHAESMNPRAYELAACGLFHISDERAEVKEVFGDLVPTFTDAADLSDKLVYWMRRPEERARIAKQLPSAVKEHNWRNRAERIIQDLLRYKMHQAIPYLTTTTEVNSG